MSRMNGPVVICMCNENLEIECLLLAHVSDESWRNCCLAKLASRYLADNPIHSYLGDPAHVLKQAGETLGICLPPQVKPTGERIYSG